MIDFRDEQRAKLDSKKASVAEVIGQTVNELGDLRKPEIIQAVSETICRQKDSYSTMDEVQSLVMEILKQGEIGGVPGRKSGKQGAYLNRLAAAEFSHMAPLMTSVATELANRCPVPTGTSLTVDAWTRNLDKDTGTDKQYAAAQKQLVTDAADILLHTPPERRTEVFSTLLKAAERAFGTMMETRWSTPERLDRHDILFKTSYFAQKVIDELTRRIPCGATLGQEAVATSKAVTKALDGGENQGKAV